MFWSEVLIFERDIHALWRDKSVKAWFTRERKYKHKDKTKGKTEDRCNHEHKITVQA